MKDLTAKIYEKYEESREGHRGYLGASEIGEECSRQLWYGFRSVVPVTFPGRILKLFNRGQLEEDIFINELESIGFSVKQFDADGKQVRFSDYDEHFAGSCDGIAEKDNDKYILEFKTHSHKSFLKLAGCNETEYKKSDKLSFEGGSVRQNFYRHYVQMQMYMGMSGIHNALYLGVNKNDDALYHEFVPFNEKIYKQHLLKAENIIQANFPPDKLSKDPSFYKCKFCNFSKVCHKDALSDKKCKTCVHASPTKDKQWSCSKYDAIIPGDTIDIGCKHHKFIPGLIDATLLDEREDHNLYEKNGVKFANVSKDVEPWDERFKDATIFTSDEISKVDSLSEMLIPAITDVKNIMEATILES